jgi:hypothetical protein
MLGIVVLSGRRLLAGDRRLRVVVGVLLVLLPFGQSYWHARTTYPLIPWDMYADPTLDRVYPEFLIRDGASAAHPYPFEQITFNMPRAFIGRVSQIVDDCRCAGGDPLADAVLDSLAAIHRDRTGRAITELEVYEVAITGASREPARRTLRYVWRPGLGPGNRAP